MPRPLAITTQAVRNELSGTGMAVYLSALGDETAQNAVIDQEIAEAQSTVENALRVFLFREIVKCRPIDAGLTIGTDYTKEESGYPFIRKDWEVYGRIFTQRRPIVSVERVAVRYGQAPGQVLEAVEYPANWISWEGPIGKVSIVPIMGSATYGAGALILLPITGGAMRRDAVPSLVTVDYTAGYLPRDFDRDADDPYDASPENDPTALLRAVRYLTTIGMLQNLSRAMGAGGGSIGMYGLSESFNPGRFEQEIQRYHTEVDYIYTTYLATDSPALVFST